MVKRLSIGYAKGRLRAAASAKYVGILRFSGGLAGLRHMLHDKYFAKEPESDAGAGWYLSKLFKNGQGKKRKLKASASQGWS